MELQSDLGFGLDESILTTDALMKTFPSADLEFEKFLETFDPADFMTDPVSILDLDSHNINGSSTEPSSNSGELPTTDSAPSPNLHSVLSGDAASGQPQLPSMQLDNNLFSTSSFPQQTAPALAAPSTQFINQAAINTTFTSIPGLPASFNNQQDPHIPSSMPFAYATTPLMQQQHQIFPAAADAKPQPQQAKQTQQKPKPKRFRERQKEEIANLEQEVERKLRQLQVLEAENDSLKLRQRVLEALVQGRTEQLQVLQEHGPPSYSAEATAEAAAAAATAAAAEGTGESQAACPGIAAQADAGIIKPACVQKIKMMSPEAVISYWKRFIREVSALLLEVGQQQEAMVKLADLVKVNGFIARHISLLNPLTRQQLSSRNMESGLVQAADEQHWLGVLAQLGLSRDQQRDCAGAHQLYLAYIGKVVAERAVIMQEMAQNAPTPGEMRAATSCEQPCQRALAYQSAVQRLASNLKREYAINLMLSCFFFGSLSTLQFAKAAVYSYPWFPDPVSFCSLLGGMRSAQQLLLMQQQQRR